MDELASLVPLEGGYSGQTFLGVVGGDEVVVRVYADPGARGAAAHEVDAALLRLMRGLLPVAEVLEVRRGDPATGLPALLVTSRLPGERGDLVLPRLDSEGRAGVGEHLGRLLAGLGGMPMIRAGGFVDGELTISAFPDGGLEDYVAARRGALGLDEVDLDRLLAVAAGAQTLLDTVNRVCLVHSDLNPKNLLLDPDTLAVTGLVDWEFAHAGHPFTDLGNLLRFERDPVFTQAVLTAYAAGRGTRPDEALQLARAADLVALVDLATRRRAHPVAALAHALVSEIARQADPGAPPPAGGTP